MLHVSKANWFFFRHAFLEERGESFSKGQGNYRSMLRRVNYYAENKLKLANKIKTVQCDASYPWPAGKAPWSLEMGGTGIPPHAKLPLLSSRLGARAASVTSTLEPPILLPAPGSFKKPKNAEEAQQMLNLARRMMEKVADFAKKEHKVSDQEAAVIKQAIYFGNNYRI